MKSPGEHLVQCFHMHAGSGTWLDAFDPRCRVQHEVFIEGFVQLKTLTEGLKLIT